MFTGIIEEIGTVKQVNAITGGKRLFIACQKTLSDTNPDDSICVNGVCLTVVKLEAAGFYAEAVGATLEKSTLEKLISGTKVNLERALTLNTRLGGHLVQGHVNGTGQITALTRLGDNYNIRIKYPDDLDKYLIKEGSVAIDGISLTIADLADSHLGISVIPHTWEKTNLKERKTGDYVNIETDVLAKYIEKLLSGTKKNRSQNILSEEWLKKLGY